MTIPLDVVAKYYDRGAQRGVTALGNAADRSSGHWRKLGGAAKFAAGGIAVGSAAAFAASLKLADGAAEDAKSQKTLALQLRNSADARKGEIAATESWITQQGKALGIADDELRPALGRMVTATHDVAKAREQVALAEDVAAGRGKSLTAVTEALAKAQNGSLAGLARLGVRTKDAAGHTRTLKEITDDLARTYKGQAAAAADTTVGKYQRLKVALSETGEELGYKMLPALNEVGDFLVDDAVPAVENLAREVGDDLQANLKDLSGWIRSDGVPMLKDFGRVVRDDVAPALRTGAEYAGDAVDMFQQLPAPIRSVGAEAAIAAIMVPRLTGALSTNAQGVRTWAADLRNGETRAQRLGAAARTAAGIGGVLALTRSTHEANDGLEALEKVGGGALAGFSVGGPIGLGLGAVAGAITAVATSGEDAGESLQFAKPKIQGFAGSLDEVSGAATRAASDVARLSLQQSGAFESGRKLGISSRDLVKASLGNEAAIRRVTRAVASAERDQLKWADSTGVIAGSYNTLAPAIAVVKNALGDTAEQFKKDQAAAREAAIANGEFGRELKGIRASARQKIVSRIDMQGWPEGAEQIAKITRGLRLTPKETKILLRTLHADESVEDIQRVLAKLRDAKPAADRANDNLGKVGTKKPNMAPWLAGLTAGLTQGKADASSGGFGVGNALQAGVMRGFSGTASELSEQASYAVHQAIASARAAGEMKSPSRRMDREVGTPLAQGAVQGFSRVMRGSGGLSAAGVRLVDDLVGGIHKRWVSKKKVLDEVRDELERRRDRLETATGRLHDAIGARNDFAGGFQRLGTGIFAADYTSRLTSSTTKRKVNPLTGEVTEETSESTRPLTIADMIAQARGERDQSKQTEKNVRHLVKDLKLSPSLIRQMQEQGDIAGINALAAGSPEQIRILNSLNKQTRGNLNSAGMVAGNRLYGATIADRRDDVARARDRAELAATVAHEVAKYLGDVEFKIRQDDLVAVLRKKDRKQGKGK